MRQKATASSWKTKPMPEAQKELALAGVYSAQEYEKISYGFLPKSRDDKWFIYLADNWLHFHRSWTGTCVFQLQFVPNDGQYQAVRAIVNCDPAQYRSTNDQQDVRMIAYLIDQLLLGQVAAFPAPRNMSDADKRRHQQHVMGAANADGSIRLQVKQNGGQKRP